MALKVGELFLNLGVKGAEKTVAAFSSLTHSLGETRNMSFEAKAAIVGAIYGFEQMMSKSGKAGTELTNFANLTGLAAKDLQQWQYAAMQAGDTSEDFTSSLIGVQQAVNNMLLGKGAPQYIGMIAKNVQKFEPEKIRDTFYLMGKLQEAAKNMPKDLGTTMLKGFGVGNATIAAFHREAFRKDVFDKAPIYSDNQIKSLDKANIAWANLGYNIQLAFGKFNAAHGVQLVNDISKITSALIKLIEALVRLGDAIKIFSVLGTAVSGVTTAINAATGGVAFAKKEVGKSPSQIAHDVSPMIAGISKSFSKLADHVAVKVMGRPITQLPEIFHSPAPAHAVAMASVAPHTSHLNNSRTNHVDVKQTVVFQGHHEAPKKTADALHKQIGSFIQQNPSKMRGS